MAKELSKEAQEALDEFIANGGQPKKCIPADVSGGTVSRATKELIREERRKFRAENNK